MIVRHIYLTHASFLILYSTYKTQEISEENSPWPRGSGGGHEVSTLLQILLARRQRPVCFEICFPPVDSTMMESLKRKRALDVVCGGGGCRNLSCDSTFIINVESTVSRKGNLLYS